MLLHTAVELGRRWFCTWCAKCPEEFCKMKFTVVCFWFNKLVLYSHFVLCIPFYPIGAVLGQIATKFWVAQTVFPKHVWHVRRHTAALEPTGEPASRMILRYRDFS